jgi:predicted transposase YdaD
MAKQYDKIIKENLLALLPTLVEFLFKVNLSRLERLKDKVQLTIEREADEYLRVCHDDPSDDFGIHFEFQTKDEDMRARNLVYFSLFYQLYLIPLKQFAIYIGEALPKKISNTILELPGLHFEFFFIDLRRISKTVFLQSEDLGCVIFAVLADYEGSSAEEVITLIVERIRNESKHFGQQRKYSKQLITLSRLRNLPKKVTDMIIDLESLIKIEEDFLYLHGLERGVKKGLKEGEKKGIEKGEKKGMEKGMEIANSKMQALVRELIIKMLKSPKFSLADILSITNVEEAFVRQVAQEEGLDLPNVQS